jgi:hypothetical protein
MFFGSLNPLLFQKIPFILNYFDYLYPSVVFLWGFFFVWSFAAIHNDGLGVVLLPSLHGKSRLRAAFNFSARSAEAWSAEAAVLLLLCGVVSASGIAAISPDQLISVDLLPALSQLLPSHLDAAPASLPLVLF